MSTKQPNPTKPRWSYLPNVRGVSPTTAPQGPWLAKSSSTIPAGISKEKFRKWSADPATTHVFYQPVIGLNPALRVSKDNPIHEMWALVGDYDCDSLIPMSDQEVLDTMDKRLNGKGIKPGWMSRTFSNKVRLVWEFDSPIPGDVEEVLRKTLELVVKETKANAILPGFDETSVFPGQTFELGKGWQPVPGGQGVTVQPAYFRATQSISMRPETLVTIPIEAVAEEVEKRWPGVWPGKFEVGTKGPLFWLNDGNPSLGAWVADNGIWSHSDRDHGWKSWGQLLGSSFVKQYEDRQIESVLDNFAYDGTRYWIKVSKNVWYDHPKENLVPRLKKMGFGDKVPKGKTISALDEALMAVQDQRRVSGAAPFLFLKEDLVEYQGMKYLNICQTKPMNPSGTGEKDHARWPFLYDYITGMLEPDPHYQVDPVHYLLAWMKRFWESAHDGTPALGQLMVVAGGVDAGKTLFGNYVLGAMMGGYGDATKQLVHGENFNKDLVHRPIWGVDDAEASGSDMGHKKFTERLKRIVANGTCDFRAMYRDGVMVQWKGRIWLSCNLDTAAREILPRLSASILDKSLLFKANDRPQGFFPPDVLQVLPRELPFFLDWLKNEYVIHPEVIPKSHRFGVSPYHHHSIVEKINQQSSEQSLAELIDLWAKDFITTDEGSGGFWEGTPTALAAEMQNCLKTAAIAPRNGVTMGKYLSRLHETGHWRVSWRNPQGQNLYRIELRPNP
jgi:hypothetical protein